MECDHCDSPAVSFIRYNGSHLCAEHFRSYVERRVKKEIRIQADLRAGDKVAVAVSGGKDSMVLLSIMSDVFDGRNGIELSCVTVDEGIDGYRPPSVDIAERFCAGKGIEFNVISFKDLFGLTMDEVAPLSEAGSPCTYCGVFRRKCLNKVTKDIGAKYIATGHNLDDMAQSIMMNFVRGDVERLARLGPHNIVQPGMIPRINPLRSLPEKESLLYAMLSGIPFHDGICPYWEAALRNEYRDIIDGLEARTPGTRHSILSSYDKLRPMIQAGRGPSEMRECGCGESTLREKCKACELSERMLELIRGP
ncbi:MAG: TIGR00269 family protein [Thermoplasmatales archaeon]|jgi:uncharacterized protein (TIGR00269 family)|nr:TIGR00269 family protein [Thermoplasmatales archaeon]